MTDFLLSAAWLDNERLQQWHDNLLLLVSLRGASISADWKEDWRR